jgi:TonB family protein
MLAALTSSWCNQSFAQDGRKVKVSPQPEYPDLARKNKIQGATRLQLAIAPDGSVKDIKVLGGNPVLVQASVEAVKKWKYEAGSAESTTVVKFEFKPDHP